MPSLARLQQAAVYRSRRLFAYFKSTPRRTFILYPIVVIATELVLRRGRLKIGPAGLPLLAWGYLQFRLVGNYRQRHGAGSRGFAGGNMPDRLLQSGPFAYSRNPMYLGHLLFLAGLADAFRSTFGQLLFAANAVWFHRRVLEDEALLREKFGDQYEAYTVRVKRWIPFVIWL